MRNLTSALEFASRVAPRGELFPQQPRAGRREEALAGLGGRRSLLQGRTEVPERPDLTSCASSEEATEPFR